MKKAFQFLKDLKTPWIIALTFISTIILLIIVVFLMNRYDRGHSEYGYDSAESHFAFEMEPMMAKSASRSIDMAVDMMMDDEPGLNSSSNDIIRTGNVTLLVDDILSKQGQVERAAKDYGGYIEHQSFYETEYDYSASLTVRVPNDNFPHTWDKINNLGTVTHQNRNNENVTDQKVDLQTRLENHQKREDRYNELLAKADDIQDILAVQEKVDNERLQIERLSAQLENLENRVAFATIYVTLQSPTGTAEVPKTDLGNTLKSAWSTLGNVFFDLVALVISTVVILPGIVLWIVFVGILLTIATFALKLLVRIAKKIFGKSKKKENKK